MKKFNNFIGGKWVAPESGEYFDNRNPADRGDVIGRFPLSDRCDVERAVESAKRGFASWRRTPAPARGDVLRTVGDIMTRRKEEIADAMTREMGKPLTETRGDVQEGIDTAYYASSEGRRLFGKTVPSELRTRWAAKTPRSSWMTRIWTWHWKALFGVLLALPGNVVPPPVVLLSRKKFTTNFWECSRVGPRRSSWATGGKKGPTLVR